jgi:hypothetical protein
MRIDPVIATRCLPIALTGPARTAGAQEAVLAQVGLTGAASLWITRIYGKHVEADVEIGRRSLRRAGGLNGGMDPGEGPTGGRAYRYALTRLGSVDVLATESPAQTPLPTHAQDQLTSSGRGPRAAGATVC